MSTQIRESYYVETGTCQSAACGQNEKSYNQIPVAKSNFSHRAYSHQASHPLSRHHRVLCRQAVCHLPLDCSRVVPAKKMFLPTSSPPIPPGGSTAFAVIFQ